MQTLHFAAQKLRADFSLQTSQTLQICQEPTSKTFQTLSTEINYINLQRFRASLQLRVGTCNDDKVTMLQ